MPESDQPATQLLKAAAEGDARAAEQLLPMVYAKLHQIAERCLGREQDAKTLGYQFRLIANWERDLI